MQSLNPAGLSPDISRILAMKCIISIGVEKALCDEGEMQSTPTGTPRAAAISTVTFGAGSTPPWPGFAPWLSFNECHNQARGAYAFGDECLTLDAATAGQMTISSLAFHNGVEKSEGISEAGPSWTGSLAIIGGKRSPPLRPI